MEPTAAYILNFPQNATLHHIKEAMNCLAYQTHPYKMGGDAKYAKIMQEINEAFRILRSQKLRRL